MVHFVPDFENLVFLIVYSVRNFVYLVLQIEPIRLRRVLKITIPLNRH